MHPPSAHTYPPPAAACVAGATAAGRGYVRGMQVSYKLCGFETVINHMVVRNSGQNGVRMSQPSLGLAEPRLLRGYQYWYDAVIEVHNDAVEDLRRIRVTDPVVFGRLFALIEQLKAEPTLVRRLLDHDFGANRSAPISVMKWHKAWQVEKVPLWRLKFWDLERAGISYRIIYFYNWRDATYYIMAIVARGSFDYDDPSHPIRHRVIQRCRQEFPGL